MAFLFAVALSLFGIRAALATHYVGLNTRAGFETAVRLEPKRAYRTSLGLNPLSADTWLDLASACETEREIDAARKAFLEAKHLYPVSAEILWGYGNFLLRPNELESAFAEFHEVYRGKPRLGGETVRICRHVEPDFNPDSVPGFTAQNRGIPECVVGTDG
jgi:tetratricopeptide (TPR) repeat protein